MSFVPKVGAWFFRDVLLSRCSVRFSRGAIQKCLFMIGDFDYQPVIGHGTMEVLQFWVVIYHDLSVYPVCSWTLLTPLFGSENRLYPCPRNMLLTRDMIWSDENLGGSMDSNHSRFQIIFGAARLHINNIRARLRHCWGFQRVSQHLPHLFEDFADKTNF